MAAGDSGCEAYTAIAWGVGLSHERSDIAGAESLYSLEGNMFGTAMRGAVARRREWQLAAMGPDSDLSVAVLLCCTIHLQPC